MQIKPENVRGEVPLKVLWKWTGVSAVLHCLFIGLLCAFSLWAHDRREAARQAKAAAEEAAARQQEATNAPPAQTNAAPVPAAPAAAGPAVSPATNPPPQAEKVLGIDKVAKPEEIPTSPFSSKADDILKDLK